MTIDYRGDAAGVKTRPDSTAIDRRRFVAAGAGLLSVAAFGLRKAVALQASPTASGPHTVDTVNGPVTVPANPTKIVAVNFPSAVALIELGVLPIGLPSYLPSLPASYPNLDAIPRIQNESGEFDIEKILSLRPDLILGSDWKDAANQQAPYAQFSKIAPTALFEWTAAAGNWPVEAAGCADAIGKTEELEKLKADYEAKAAAIKSSYTTVLASNTWDIISANDDNWFLYGPTSSHGQVAVAAGVKLNAAADQTDGYVQYTFEDFDLLAQTNALLVRTVGDTTLDTLSKKATFTSLSAYTANHLYESDFFFPSSYGLSSALLADIETGLKALSAS